MCIRDSINPQVNTTITATIIGEERTNNNVAVAAVAVAVAAVTNRMMMTVVISVFVFMYGMVCLSRTTVTAHIHTPASMTRMKASPSAMSISIRSTSSSVTMMAITAAGISGRTLIEIGERTPGCSSSNSNSSNSNNYQQEQQFQIDVSYLDDDYENGLLILRRANTIDATTKTVPSCKAINSGHDHHQQQLQQQEQHHSLQIVQNVIKAIKHPIVASVLLGNVVSVLGVIPYGISGFFRV